MGDIEEALAFFANEIEQYEMILKGVLSIEYESFVHKKIQYYQLALYAIEKSRIS